MKFIGKKGISRKGVVKKLDSLVSKIVQARDKKCATCSSIYKLGCGHLFSRIAYSTRWDLDNCHCQCWSCNFKHTYDTYPYFEWYRDKFGEKAFDALHRKFVTPQKFKTYELLEMYQVLYDEWSSKIDL